MCIICSGLGSAGIVGLKMVMENFGMVMAQDPASTAFDAMPRVALATEFVDFVLLPELLPAQLLNIPLIRAPRATWRPTRLAGRPTRCKRYFCSSAPKPGKTSASISAIPCSGASSGARIRTRLRSSHTTCTPPRGRAAFSRVADWVTKFFRDADAFAALKAHLRPLLAGKPADSAIRVWAPGCSMGEEAYLLAMTLFECLNEAGLTRHLKVQLFATDISAEGVARSWAGLDIIESERRCHQHHPPPLVRAHA